MEVYLVRHTETTCEKGICYGQSDVDIIEPYDMLFEAILEQLPQNAILFSSPLKRCAQLANYILANTTIDAIKTDNRLMEMNFGDWELKKWDDIPFEILNPWMSNFVTVNVPNGESFIDVHNRVHDFIENGIDNKGNVPVILVAHSGVIRSILCQLNSIPLQDAFKSTIDYGSVIKIEL